MLSTKHGKIWLGSAPAPDGPGIQLSPEGLVSWNHGVRVREYPWDDLTEVQLLVAETRMKFPRAISWAWNLFLTLLASWGPEDPEMLYVDIGGGVVPHDLQAIAGNAHGYAPEEVEAVTAKLRRYASQPAARAELAGAAAFVPGLTHPEAQSPGKRQGHGPG